MIGGIFRDEVVLVIARIAGRAPEIIRMLAEDDVAQHVVEIDLADEQFVAFDEDATVNMRRAALVPSRIGGQKACLPLGVRQLAAAEGEPADRLGIAEGTHFRSLAAGIDAAVIGMPDFDIGIFNRPAIGCMNDPNGQPQRQPGLSFRNVLTGRDIVDMARAKSLGDCHDAIRTAAEERLGQLFQGNRLCAAADEIRSLPVECPGGNSDMPPRPDCCRSHR